MERGTKANNPFGGLKDFNINMFVNGQVDEIYIKQFAELGVTNENDIVTILNGLDKVADICYAWYINNKVNKSNYNEAKN